MTQIPLLAFLVMAHSALGASSPEPRVSADAPLLHLDFEGDLMDVSGNSHHGVVNGELEFISGPQGLAADFDGTTDVLFPSLPDDVLGADFTLAFWLLMTSADSESIVSKRAECTAGAFLDIRARFDINLEIGTASGSETANATLRNGWTFYVGRRQGDQYELYLDGVLRDDFDGSSTLEPINQEPLGIGNSPCVGGSTASFTGLIDELQLYTRALTLEEIRDLGPGLIHADGFETGNTSAWSP